MDLTEGMRPLRQRNVLRGWRFSQRCCQGFQSAGVTRCVAVNILPSSWGVPWSMKQSEVRGLWTEDSFQNISSFLQEQMLWSCFTFVFLMDRLLCPSTKNSGQPLITKTWYIMSDTSRKTLNENKINVNTFIRWLMIFMHAGYVSSVTVWMDSSFHTL
jgi:hypothetical protein